MGVGRIRARPGGRRPREGTDPDRPDLVRGSGHACLRRLAEDGDSWDIGSAHRRGRSLLETSPMKAGEIVDRIKKQLGVPWRDATYRDTFKSGSADTEVTGIATTCFVTLDVIRKAAAAKLNLIIPHEDTFWNDRDDQAVVGDDALYKAKLELLTKHNV